MNIPWCLLPKKNNHQKGARLGATAPVRCSALQILVALFAKNHVIHQGSNPGGYSSWWVGSNHSSPGSWRISCWILLKYQKHKHIFGIGNLFQELQRQRAMAEAYCVWSHHGVDHFLCAWQLRTHCKDSQTLSLAGNSRQNRCQHRTCWS